MTGPAYHGWTHRSKARGGTDPIEAGQQPISAYAYAATRSQTCTGNLPIDFDQIWANDPSFGYTVVTGGRARYITISMDGWYEADFTVYWDTDWTVGDFPYIEPSDYVSGFASTLVNDIEVGWDNTQFLTATGEQFTTAEMDHHALQARMLFNFTTAYFGFPSIGIGVNMRAGSTRTKNFGGQITVTRLGDALTQRTIA